jgi:hypothetical protein
VPEDEKIESRRRSAVLRGVDLAVGTVHAYPQDLHQYSAPPVDVGHRWLRQLLEVRAI